MAIPAVLVFFVRRRRDVPFPWMFWMFGAFIVSCGFTHLMEVVTSYVPLYRLSGLVKLLTAVVSWATVIGLVPLLPRALAHHAWYRQKFADYPRRRRALIPFLL